MNDYSYNGVVQCLCPMGTPTGLPKKMAARLTPVCAAAWTGCVNGEWRVLVAQMRQRCDTLQLYCNHHTSREFWRMALCTLCSGCKWTQGTEASRCQHSAAAWLRYDSNTPHSDIPIADVTISMPRRIACEGRTSAELFVLAGTAPLHILVHAQGHADPIPCQAQRLGQGPWMVRLPVQPWEVIRICYTLMALNRMLPVEEVKLLARFHPPCNPFSK